MRRLILVLGFVTPALTCFAQSAADTAFHVADKITANSWAVTEQVLTNVDRGMRVRLMAAGASDAVVDALSNGFRQAFTREKFTERYAHELSESFSAQELAGLAAFFDSELGEKYLRIVLDPAFINRLAKPLAKEACATAQSELTSGDREVLAKACGGRVTAPDR